MKDQITDNNTNETIDNITENVTENVTDEKEAAITKTSIADKIKASFKSRKFRGGAYATAVSAVVIIIILVLNIIVTELDLKVDISKEGTFTLTDVTKNYVKNIKDDITIYYLAQTGQEDKTTTEIIQKYPQLSGHIKVEYKDPVLYPSFAQKYYSDAITNNSVLVVNNSNDRAKYIPAGDMIVSEVDYNTYQSYQTGIDVEGQVTSALQYVTTEDLPIMYTVTGHGEAELGTTITTSLGKINVTSQSINTLTSESIPEDCSVLLINAPQKDYSPDEVTMIKEYLSKGGDALIYTDYNTSSLENFASLLDYYGVSQVTGLVVEGSRNHYMGQYMTYLVPDYSTHEITTDLKSDGTYVVAPLSSGLQTLDTARSTITTAPILVTSDEAYSKTDINSTNSSKEAGDIDGPFNLGISVTETYNEAETKLVVYGSSALIDESMVSSSSLGNLDLFLNSVNYVTDKADTLAVRTVSTQQQYLNVTAAQANLWSVLMVIVLPVFVLGTGGFVVLRRRKK